MDTLMGHLCSLPVVQARLGTAQSLLCVAQRPVFQAALQQKPCMRS